LAGEPPDEELLVVALDAALLVGRARPSSELLDWLGRADADQAKWDGRATTRLLAILRDGDARSWRFLETSGVLERTLPELASVLRQRRDDPFLLDPAHVLRFDLVERMRDVVHHDPRAAAAFERLRHPERPLLAAFVIAATGGVEPDNFGRQLCDRLRLGSWAETELVALVRDRDLLLAAANRIDGLDEEPLLPLAAHLETPERTRALYVLSLAFGELDEPTRDRLDELLARILRVQAQSELTGPRSVTVVEARRREALALLDRTHGADDWVRTAPRAYLLSTPTADVARHAALLEPLPRHGTARVAVTMLPGGDGRIELAATDRPGLVAVVAGVLTKLGFDVKTATMTTWPSGAALQSFAVQPLPGTAAFPDAPAIAAEIEAAFEQPLVSPPLPDVDLSFDDDASPWYTLCEVRSRNRPGLLHAVATGFAAAGVSIHAARIDTRSDVAIDRFEVTDANGAKLGDVHQRAASAAIHGGVTADRPARRRWSGLRTRA
jgi:[protein-PII] uridylyltransferase